MEEFRMSAADNVATVQAIYEAFGRGDVETILGKLSDDVDWAPDAAGDGASWWGERHGRDEVVGFFAGIAAATEVTEFTPIAIASTDNEVLTFVRYGFHAKDGGPTATMNLHHYFRFDSAGKVDCYRGGEDTQLTAATLAGAAV
jgi:ketosteroid isomerase-like protein